MKAHIFTDGQNLIGQSNNLDHNLWPLRYLGSATDIVSSSEIAPNGKPEALVLMANTPGWIAGVYIAQYFGFEPNRYYTVSVWAKRFNTVPSVGRIVNYYLPLGTQLTETTAVNSVTTEWNRYSLTFYTNSITSVTTTWVSVHHYTNSPAQLGYWGLSVTKTDTLYPYVPTTSALNSDFLNLMEVDALYGSKYSSKLLGQRGNMLDGSNWLFGRTHTDATKLNIAHTQSSYIGTIGTAWEVGSPMYCSDGVYPESYRRNIVNATAPAHRVEEYDDTMRSILDLERYY